MKPCDCVGINITWACNCHCLHCFYYEGFSLFKTPTHIPLNDLKKEIDQAIKRGCTKVTLIGYGEPLLYPDLHSLIKYCVQNKLLVNIITNGTFPLARYEMLFDLGIDHIQISAHHTGRKLDPIIQHEKAGEKQKVLMEWLYRNKLPFRTNTTITQHNYTELPEILTSILQYHPFHVALLNFLPHYSWQGKAHNIAVHPATLRPYVETAIEVWKALSRACLLTTNLTLRYFPLCHLEPDYWKYVVNARYVLFDALEWDYGHYSPYIEEVWPHALQMGESVRVKGWPCERCMAEMHCGGWNKAYADAFSGASLKPITQVPDQYEKVWKDRGGLHDLNPATSMGWPKP